MLVRYFYAVTSKCTASQLEPQEHTWINDRSFFRSKFLFQQRAVPPAAELLKYVRTKCVLVKRVKQQR